MDEGLEHTLNRLADLASVVDERALLIARAREQGGTWATICDHSGLSRSGAVKAAKRYLTSHPEEERE